MVLLLGLILLQVVRPLPGPEGSPHNVISTSDITPSIGPSNTTSISDSSTSSSNNNIVPDKAIPGGTLIYGGKAGPLMSNAPPEEPLSDSFHPSIAVIIGVLSTMFSLTFLILLYAKHCKRPPVSVYGGQDHDVINPAPLSNLGAAGLLFGAGGADRDSGLDKAVVEALPMFSFSALKGMKEGLECAVCLSKYENPEVLRLLPKCKHAFHSQCVDVWLDSHSTCPLCRVRVDAQDTLVVDDFLSGFKPGSEPPSFRHSARISLSELADHYLDRAFEFYVQREADSADILAGAGCWNYGSGRSSWRKDHGGSERKLGSWRSSANFSGPFGASERKELGSARVTPLQMISNGELYGSQRKASDAGVAGSLNVTAAAGSMPLNYLAAAGDDHFLYDEQLARRLGHRIIVSDVMLQHRWSDFLPSDVPFSETNIVQLRERSAPASGELAIKAAGNDQESIKDMDLEAGLQKAGGERSARVSSARVADGDVAATAALQVTVQEQLMGVTEKQKKQGGNQRGKVGGSRLRCMSELSGLQRVQQLQAGNKLLQGASSADVEVPSDESARRWFATARRTLKWLIGSGPAARPTSSSLPSPLDDRT